MKKEEVVLLWEPRRSEACKTRDEHRGINLAPPVETLSDQEAEQERRAKRISSAWACLPSRPWTRRRAEHCRPRAIQQQQCAARAHRAVQSRQGRMTDVSQRRPGPRSAPDVSGPGRIPPLTCPALSNARQGITTSAPSVAFTVNIHTPSRWELRSKTVPDLVRHITYHRGVEVVARDTSRRGKHGPVSSTTSLFSWLNQPTNGVRLTRRQIFSRLRANKSCRSKRRDLLDQHSRLQLILLGLLERNGAAGFRMVLSRALETLAIVATSFFFIFAKTHFGVQPHER